MICLEPCVVRARSPENWENVQENDYSINKSGRRNILSFETNNHKNNVSSSQRHSNEAKNADFSHANLSKIVRLKDLNKNQFADDAIIKIQEQTEILNLAYNEIEYLDESIARTFTSIKKLNLAYNRIENFSLHDGESYSSLFNHLEILNLTGNYLKSFQSTQTKSLKVIDLSCNFISEPTKLNISQLNGLEYMDLSCNRFNILQTETLQNASNLKVLNLAGNLLSDIRKCYFECLSNINVLILSKNHIQYIESDAFAYLANLQFLDLSYNDLSVNSLHALQNVPNLSALSLAFNKGLGNFLQGFVTSWNIKELDVSGTELIEIPAALTQSVHSLNLSRNHFTVNILGK